LITLLSILKYDISEDLLGGKIMLSRQQEFGSRILYRGLQGEDVKELQSKLESLGYDAGPIDGIFGPLTEKAVRKFQKDNDLVVDGIVGQETFAALERLVP